LVIVEQRRPTQGPHFQKIDSFSKFFENFNDFVDFSLKGRFLEKVEGPHVARGPWVGRRCCRGLKLD
jgi:hypothetical protein